MTLNPRLEQKLVQATEIIEAQIDQEMEKLDRMDNRDLELVRKRRIEEMKTQAKNRETWILNGHGTYNEIPSEKDFFDDCRKSDNLVVHFFRDVTFRCKIVDKHFAKMAPRHMECKFVKLNAEKAPFLTQRLGVLVIPSILILRNQIPCDIIVGFDDLGGHDEFTTEMLEWRVARAGVLDYKGDLNTPPDAPGAVKKKKTPAAILGHKQDRKNIRGKNNKGDSSDDDWE